MVASSPDESSLELELVLLKLLHPSRLPMSFSYTNVGSSCREHAFILNPVIRLHIDLDFRMYTCFLSVGVALGILIDG